MCWRAFRKDLNTPVGEGGWGLSGGEAHRVALARTFLGRAPLVLLDEPTAHLDAASESAITEIIATLSRSANVGVAAGLGGWTIVVLSAGAGGRFTAVLTDSSFILPYLAFAVCCGALALYATRIPRGTP